MLLCAHHQATRCCRLHNQAGVGMESTHKSRSGGGGVVRRLLRLAVAEHGAAAVARHGDDDRISREGRKGSRASALRGVACIPSQGCCMHPSRGVACIPPGVLHAPLQGCCMHPSRGAACIPQKMQYVFCCIDFHSNLLFLPVGPVGIDLHWRRRAGPSR